MIGSAPSSLGAFDNKVEALVDDEALALIILAPKAGVIFVRKTGQGKNHCLPLLLGHHKGR